MKPLFRLFFCAAFLLLSASVCAQYGNQYYHRVGDTIEWKPNNGYFSWWEFETFYQENITLAFNPLATLPTNSDSARLLQYFYTPAPLKVIGVAGATLQIDSIPGSYYDWFRFIDTSTIPEYYLIYDADSTEFTLKSRTKWSPFDPHRTVHIMIPRGYISSQDSCCTNSWDDFYFPIFEYYFDEPFFVTDSFYVGTTNANGAFHPELFRVGVMAFIAGVSGSYNCGTELIEVMSKCYVPGILQKGIGLFPNTISYALNPDRWWWTSESSIPIGGVNNSTGPLLIYPIVEVDTTVPPPELCDSLRNVQVTATDSTAIVTWDNFPNYSSVYIKYGYGSSTTWHSVDVTGNTSYTLTGLEPGRRYGVTMMAECEISKKQTPWTEPIYFYTDPDTTGSEGIPQSQASLLAIQTFLQPNPAQDNTTVSSFFNLKRIEILDVHGVMVYSAPVSGHRATVSLDGLRAGTYVVAVHTHNGTTHKRLVVTR